MPKYCYLRMFTVTKSYCAKVRIGNWFEDSILQFETTKEFLRKKKTGKLFLQQTRELFCNVLKKVSLSENVDFIRFGHIVQIKAPGMPGVPLRGEEDVSGRFGVVLAPTINENEIHRISQIYDGCVVVCSPCLNSCVRNSFIIESADCHDLYGHNLKFGQEFMLRLTDTTNGKLYVRSEIPLVDDPHGPLQHIPIKMSSVKDRFGKWKVLIWNSARRFETEGATVPASARVIIRHVMSGKCLAVESTEWYVTIFGKQCGASVHTYADVYKQETAECLWNLHTKSVAQDNL